MGKGFVDIQSNGWMGTDLSGPGLTPERVKAITLDLSSRGTVAWCPTIVTGDTDVYRKNFAAVTAAMRDGEVGRRILGIHLEGPFLSPEPGARGAHPVEHMRDPDPDLFDQFQEWAEGNIRILTVAPERPGCVDLIRHVTAGGVVVSMGHHLASDDQLGAAVDAGATLCTHIGNGLPNEIHRHRNPLWWQLSDDRVSGMFITDGHHLPAPLIKVALRAKSIDRFIVTSDASPLAGMPPEKYRIFGNLPVVIDDTGLIYSEESQSLAGSHSTVLECMNHLASLELLGEEDLWQVGLHNPLRTLGLTTADVDGLDSGEMVFEDGRFAIAAG